MLKKLDREDRLRLMKFVCSFAWADLEVQDAERQFVGRLVDTLGLDGEERAQVEGWLEVPPKPEEVDPAEIPPAHRQLFLDAAKAMIAADGKLSEDEIENFAIFELLVK